MSHTLIKRKQVVLKLEINVMYVTYRHFIIVNNVPVFICADIQKKT